MNEKELTHIDLFSGIGGFTLAAEWAGFKTIAFCEKDDFCKKILQKHWPEIPIISEIRDFDGTKHRGSTLLTGGFPCQPFSVAGKRRGKEDDRYLWPEMLRVINEAKPSWILAENVPGIFHMALDTVLTDLEGEGYATGTFIIPACALNAPHKRNRIWIIANSKGRRIQGRSISIRSRQSRKATCYPERSCQDAPNAYSRRNRRYKSKGIEERATACSGNKQVNPNSSSKRLSKPQKSSFEKSFLHAQRGDWEKDWYEVAARFCRVDDGVSNRIHRLKALGNAIVPQIAYEILKNIAWIEKSLK